MMKAVHGRCTTLLERIQQRLTQPHMVMLSPLQRRWWQLAVDVANAQQ